MVLVTFERQTEIGQTKYLVIIIQFRKFQKGMNLTINESNLTINPQKTNIHLQ